MDSPGSHLNFKEETLQGDHLSRLLALVLKVSKNEPLEGVAKEFFEHFLEIAELLFLGIGEAKNREEIKTRLLHPSVRWFLAGPSDLQRAEFVMWLETKGMTTRMGEELTGLGQRSYRDLRAVAKLPIECKTILATNRNIKEAHIRKLRPHCPRVSLETRMRYAAQYEPNCKEIEQWVRVLLDRWDDPEGALKELLKDGARSSVGVPKASRKRSRPA